jgi:hypothetical protein
MPRQEGGLEVPRGAVEQASSVTKKVRHAGARGLVILSPPLRAKDLIVRKMLLPRCGISMTPLASLCQQFESRDAGLIEAVT